jgi:hypothetical protein
VTYDEILGPEDLVDERPFTDPRHTSEEAEVMRAALAELRLRAAPWGDEPRRRIVQRDQDEHGLRHLIVVPDTHELLGAERLTAVGFFGRARDGVDHGVLFDLEEELVAGMDEYADVGLVTYYDVELPKSGYGNLVLFSTLDVPPEWASNAVHRHAVEISPAHYDYVRLHKGTVLGRLLDGCELTIDRTKYLDFDNEPGWRAVRQFA